MFISFAERASPQIMLCAVGSYADINNQEYVIDTNLMQVEVGISDPDWNPLFDYGAGMSKKTLRQTKKTFIDSDMGLVPQIAEHGSLISTFFVKVGSAAPLDCQLKNPARWQWQERMEGLTWSRDMKGGKTSGKAIRYYCDKCERLQKRLRTSMD